MFKEKLLKCTNGIKVFLSCVIILLMGIVYIFTSGKGNNQFNPSLDEEVSENIQESITKESITKQSSAGDNTPKVYVYVCGSVVNPGVYQADTGMRVFQLIELAGGVNEEADITSLNMAGNISDGQKIYVPSYGENIEQNDFNIESKTSLININTATKEQLMTLPGIGESKATDIIIYRQDNGKFENAEDIKKISGIKDAAYNKIKDYITAK